VEWVSEKEIALPRCEECGTRITLLVHGEIVEPIITKDEQTGKILQVAMPRGAEHHGNLWIVDKDLVKQKMPHPSFAHLSPEQLLQLQQIQAAIKSMAPDAPIDWMVPDAIREDIKNVYPHPAVARHQSLAQQMIAAGKTYQPPVFEQRQQQVFTLEDVQGIVTDLLKNLGIGPQPNSQPLPTQPATVDEYPALPPIRLP
jgi:hypothetical protein